MRTTGGRGKNRPLFVAMRFYRKEQQEWHTKRHPELCLYCLLCALIPSWHFSAMDFIISPIFQQVVVKRAQLNLRHLADQHLPSPERTELWTCVLLL